MKTHNDLKKLNKKVGLDIKTEPTGPGKCAMLMSINHEVDVVAKAVEVAMNIGNLNHTKHIDNLPPLSDNELEENVKFRTNAIKCP